MKISTIRLAAGLLAFLSGGLAVGSDALAAAPTIGPNINLTRAAGNQYEAAVAIDPNDAKHIFMASRNELGGLSTARSSDGGVTWTSKLIAVSNTPAAGDIPRAYGNVSVAWDTLGNLFLTYLQQGSTGSLAYVALTVSTDGGATFKSPTGAGSAMYLPTVTPPIFGDQPTVTVGPGNGPYPGSVWLTYFTRGGIAVSGGGVTEAGIYGPITSQLLPAQPPGVSFGDIAVGPNGEVIVTYGPDSGGSGGTLYTQTDPDGLGPAGFSAPNAVVTTNLGGFTYIPAQPNWGIDPEAGLAWDRTNGPNRGRVYLVYTDATTPGGPDTDIVVVTSDNQGASWSTPVRVNDDAGANSQFLPRIALDQSSGNIAVTWYDARNAPDNKSAQYWGAFSTDGGATFTPNFQISTGASNQANSIAALKKTDFGDYTGNAFSQGKLVPAWADNSNSTGDNPNGATNFDVYTAIVQAPTINVVVAPPVTQIIFPSTPASGWFNAIPVTGTVAASSVGDVIAHIDCTGGAIGPVSGAGIASALAAIGASAQGSNAISCTATDSNGHTGAAAQALFWIDSVAPGLAPALSIAAPVLNAVVTAQPNASDAGSGVTAASCGPVGTASLGARSVICSATDAAGNTTSAGVSYVVGLGLGNLQVAPATPVKPGRKLIVSLQLTDANGAVIANALARSLGTCAVTASMAGATPVCLANLSGQLRFQGPVSVAAGLAPGIYPLTVAVTKGATKLGGGAVSVTVVAPK